MFTMPKPPYLGAAYYPEDWPESEIDRDIEKLHAFGITCVRIGEFAWHRMEPKPGKYDFSFFRRVVDKMKQANIAVVMGTPTATPPRWFTRDWPDALRLDPDGRRVDHGGRRHCCSNNPRYNEASMRIVEEMAKEFASDENIIGWQIDNEIYTGNAGCFCPECVNRFRAALKKRYGTIDNLNNAWNLNLFSQWYDSFEEIPAPRNAWHNPHLKMEWQTFQNDSHIGFVHRQAEILHRYVKVPVGTDTMPVNGMDYRRLTEKLDIAQFNHYNTPENLHFCAFWHDYMRTFLDHPFWNTETATCWNGSTTITQSVKPDGFCRANSWLPIALGGEANMYWLWRTHWAGHELMHGAVLDTSGRPMLAEEEVKETAAGFRKAADFVRETKVAADVAIHFTSLNWNMFEQQGIVKGLNYQQSVVGRFYKPLIDLGLRPDVIDAHAALDDYRVVFSPLMLTLEEAGLPQRMEQWVREGGTWIVGPLSDERNRDGARYTDCLYGMLERLMGVEWKYALPDTEGRTAAAWTDGTPMPADTWFEVSNPGKAESLATIVKGHRAILGKTVVARSRLGKGQIVLLGALPAPETTRLLAQKLLPDAGVRLPEVVGEVIVSPRRGAMNGEIVLEYAGKPASYTLPAPAVDLLTGEALAGTVELEPYQVLVLKR